MVYNCRVCDKEVKLLKNHLRISHNKMKLEEYLEMYKDEIEKYDRFNIYMKEERRKHSPNCIEFYLNKGYSNDDSVEMLEKHRSKQPFRLKKDFRPNQIGYWIKKGFNDDEALEKLTLFQSRTEKSNIEKYGLVEGKRIYQDFLKSLDKRKETEINNISEKFSIDKEKAESVFRKRRIEASPRRIEYWVKKGFNEEDANLKMIEWQVLNSPRRIEHWINKGFDEDEALKKLSKWQDNISIEMLMEKQGLDKKEAMLKQDSYVDKMLNTKIDRGLIIPLDSIECFLEYRKMVDKESNRNYKKNKNLINPNNYKRSIDYHLDHKYSVFEGYKNDIDYKIIGSVYNLEIITREENLSKGIKSSIMIEDLIKKYNN